MAGNRRASWRVLLMDHQVCAKPHPTACLRYAGEVAANSDSVKQTQAGRSMNPFLSARPRGAGVIAPIKPVKRNTPGAALTVKGTTRVMNSRGVFQAQLAPDASRSIVIESREQSQASADRRASISPRGTK